MALRLLAHEVSDLCLGKPALRSLTINCTISDALQILKNSDDTSVSIWDCHHKPSYNSAAVAAAAGGNDCQSIGKISMVDVILYLSKEENLNSPSSALKAPLSVLLPEIPGLVMHVEPSCSLLGAIELMLKGAQNLVIPIKSRASRRKQLQKPSATTTTTIHSGREYCWLTQDDVIRFLLSSIGLFSPIPALSIDSLGIIKTDVITINYHSPASAALSAISRSHTEQTSVAVLDSDGILIGEISPYTLACCDETVAAALITLSAGDFMAYIDCGGGPPEDLVRLVTARLEEKKLNGMVDHLTSSSSLNSTIFCSSSSSDDESRVTPLPRSGSGRNGRSVTYSSRMVRRAEAIVCHSKSSLVAVMVQAIAHRVNYVWVIEEDCSLVGIVTFSDLLRVFPEHLDSMA